MSKRQTPSSWSVLTALAAIYLIWGSTYLAIRWAVETIPPFLMAGTRFFIAGALLYLWMRLRGVPKPEPFHWVSATIVGGCLLLGGNGGVVWVEKGGFPSGLTALMIATVPLWMALLQWLRGVRLGGGVAVGLLLGFVGIILLIGPGELSIGGRVDTAGATVLIGASLSWAVGSLYSRRARLPESALLATAMEMLAGGALLILTGLVLREHDAVRLDAISSQSFFAYLYLILFGSLVGFTAYIWLLRVTTPVLVSTYAYVNPVVAVLLGATLAGETITIRTLLAAAVILTAVALITSYGAFPKRT
ncbi:MAG: drug/metabolite exporter YedA [Candidatus Bipolaricaulota bacterium]|nr:drug/metabolite exporter YedA [Candidatus Bipolaricaulota bacterium]